MSRLIGPGLVFSCFLWAATAFPKPPVFIPPVNPNDPPALSASTNRSVLVIGGGLAGLSAALELSERGFAVTIREAGAVLGGRLHTYQKDIADVGTFAVEHGFHGWFHNYHTFKNIRTRLGIDKNFRPWGAVHYLFKKYLPEAIESLGPYPLNLLGIIKRSPNLHLTDAIKTVLALPDLIGFDYTKVYEQYDHLTFFQWAQLRKVDQKFFDIIMRPALSVTVNERATISAAEMLTYFQLYFMSDAKADTREVPTSPWSEAIVGPWNRHLRAHGVAIEVESPVPGIVFEDMKAVATTDRPERRFDHVLVATHLSAVQAILNASVISANMGSTDPVTTDARTAAAVQAMAASIAPLRTAPAYKILRGWFDGKPNASRPDILETPDFAPVNLIAQYHLIEDESAAWANKTGGSILEFHLYTWKYASNMTDQQVWATIAPTVFGIYPEMKSLKVLGLSVGSFQNFASFCTGSAAHRPTSSLGRNHGLTNLAFAGDWLHTSYPSALMERAVSTGREAANLVLLAESVRQASLTVTSSHGPGIL